MYRPASWVFTHEKLTEDDTTGSLTHGVNNNGCGNEYAPTEMAAAANTARRPPLNTARNEFVVVAVVVVVVDPLFNRDSTH